jgi:aminoglycoside phosphotransferase (APT) family kinase protein
MSHNPAMLEEEKATWRRGSPATTVTSVQLAEVLATAGLSDSVTRIELLAGGLVNTNYRLDLAGGETLVLRLYDRDGSACAREAALLRMVSGTVPVPAVVHVEPDGFGALPPLLLMTYIEGISLRALKATLPDEELGPAARVVGQVLARIHAFRFPKPGSLGSALDAGPWFAEPPDIVPKLIEGLPPRLEAGLARRVDAFIANIADRLSQFDTEARLVHSDYDYGSANVLLRRMAGGSEVAAVLDWEFAFSGCPLWDLGNLLRYERESRPRFEPHASRGYIEAGGELPDDWRLLARAFDLVSLCELLTREGIPPDMAAEITELIESTLGTTGKWPVPQSEARVPE